jgi:16S rRNA (cytosine967-C5)-methyltransferase
MENVRKIALMLLTEYEELGKYVNLSLSSHKADGLSHNERAFLTALLYTTVEHKITYDYYIAHFAKRNVEDISRKARNLLRLGVCQLLDMDIPSHAAVNETVKLCGTKGERAFVNGILRAIERERDSLVLPDREKNVARYLSVKYSFSQKIVKKLIEIFGSDEAEKLLVSFNTRDNYTDITVNTEKISREELKERLILSGVSVIESPYSEITLRITSPFDPRRSELFNNGYFFVQDTASALAVLSLGIKSGDVVADVCAAPGGKSFTAAILTGSSGRVHSFDLHESKLSLIEDTRKRLSLDNITVAMRDGTQSDEALHGACDAVICDVPCSGLGVLSKKPDLRYKELSGLAELPNLQIKILTESSKYLKVGGKILYSTCTLNPDENCEVVNKFLSENPLFEPVEFTVGSLKSEGGMLTLYPHINNTDGFFICNMRKKG